MNGMAHDFLSNLIGLGTGSPHVYLLEKIVRPVIVYLLLGVTLRLVGKRMLAQLNPFDFVVLLLLSNTVQNAIIGNDTSLSGGIVGAAALLAANAIVVRLLYRSPDAGLRGEGAELALWSGGAEQAANLRRLHITVPELEVKAHERGFETLHDVDSITLGPNGTLSFSGREAHSEERRHRELLDRLDALQREVAALNRFRA